MVGSLKVWRRGTRQNQLMILLYLRPPLMGIQGRPMTLHIDMKRSRSPKKEVLEFQSVRGINPIYARNIWYS